MGSRNEPELLPCRETNHLVELEVQILRRTRRLAFHFDSADELKQDIMKCWV
jgi:hypothetical protein